MKASVFPKAIVMLFALILNVQLNAQDKKIEIGKKKEMRSHQIKKYPKRNDIKVILPLKEEKMVYLDVNLNYLGVSEETRNRIDNGDCKRIFGIVSTELWTIGNSTEEAKRIEPVKTGTEHLFYQRDTETAPPIAISYYQDDFSVNNLTTMNKVTYLVPESLLKNGKLKLYVKSQLGTRHKDNHFASYDILSMKKPVKCGFLLNSVKSQPISFSLKTERVYKNNGYVQYNNGISIPNSSLRGSDDTHKIWVRLTTKTKVQHVVVTAEPPVRENKTNFDPEIHGFNFSNTFAIEPIQGIRFEGFCGGMVYTALDYFTRGIDIPEQPYKPEPNSLLYEYIWGRQRSSVLDNLHKWTELFVNPFGWRSGEYFNWGLQGFGSGTLLSLKKSIDRGEPVPIGLFRPGNGGNMPHHVVLAIGYDMGRYKGDLKSFKRDVEITVYDPNHPNETRILTPDPHSRVYYYKYHRNKKEEWMAYFKVDNYGAHLPPKVSYTSDVKNGLVHSIVLEIITGNDDLRGGSSDNFNVNLYFKTGPPQTFRNVNNSNRWIGKI